MRGLHRPSDPFGGIPIELDLRAVSLEEGARAGLSVAMLVAADNVFHAPLLLEAALGALLTCLCDSGGPVARRLPPMLGFGVVGAALIGLLGLARPIGYPLIPLACLGIFAFSFLRIYGQAAQQVGNLLSVVLVLALDRPLMGLGQAATLGGLFLGGSLWALVLTLVIWRLHPNRPTRQAVARVHLGLAALCDDLRALLATDTPADAAWERHARAHRRRVRTLIEQAREIIAERLRAGGSAVQPATRSLLRLEAADQMFAALIALADLMEAGADATARSAADGIAQRIGAILRALAPHVVDDTDHGLTAISQAIDGIAVPDQPPVLHRIADLLAERLRATLTLTGTIAAVSHPAEQPTLRDRLIAPLQANLNRDSVALRHAARAGLVSVAGLAVTFTWPTSYQHWLTITLILTLQPYYAVTLQRALERIGGTVLGGLIAVALSLVCRTPLAIAAAIVPLSMITLSLRSVNFGLYITALTPTIVLLVELGHAGSSHLAVAAMRALYTIIGGSLAVLGCILLWPSWEPDRLERELRTALQSHGRYADLELAMLLGETTAEAVAAARRAAGMASNNLEASLSRALLEPRRRGGRNLVEAATVVDAALRRLAGRLTVMQIDPIETHGEDAALLQWRSWITTAVNLLIQPDPPTLPPRPDTLPSHPPIAEALRRIARQLDLAGGALRRCSVG